MNWIVKKAIDSEKDIKKNVISFFVNNPYPNDEKVHAFAKENDIEPDVLEKVIYDILSSFISEGKYNEQGEGLSFEDGELEKGIKVEREHTNCDLIAERIALDHLSEDGGSKYYSYLDLMEKLMKSNVSLDKIKELLKNKE